MRRLLSYLLLVAIAGSAWLAYHFDPRVRDWVGNKLALKAPAPKIKSIPPAPVRVAVSERRDVPILLEGVGNVQARSTIAVKARVDGQIMEAAVLEGQLVKKGDLLFRLDARPYEAQLRQAEANVARDRANLEKAQADANRAESLTQKGISPKTKLEEAETSVAALKAAIQSSEAAVEIAKLNREYATIKAPVDGRVGSFLLAPGNMVKANDIQAIVMLTEVRPINVAFALPEQHVGELRSRLKSAEPVVVEATVQGDEATAEQGELFFINNSVDPTTGTIMVMARFTNHEERLVPGQFVKARVRMTTLPGAIVVPSKGLQINTSGHYVWVIKPDMTADLRPVSIGPEIGDIAVVSRGLQAGEQIVLDGQLRLFPGAKVTLSDGPQKRIKSKGQS